VAFDTAVIGEKTKIRENEECPDRDKTEPEIAVKTPRCEGKFS
jgi:hypothetical protein